MSGNICYPCVRAIHSRGGDSLSIFTLHLHSPSSLSIFTLHLHSPSSLSIFTLHLHSPSSLLVFNLQFPITQFRISIHHFPTCRLKFLLRLPQHRHHLLMNPPIR